MQYDGSGRREDRVSRVPGRSVCLECSESFAIGRTDRRCPECGSEWLKPINDQECYVESIEVETAEG